jgi:hypothetical protein
LDKKIFIFRNIKVILINLDFRESQRRENEPLLDESGNWVSQKNGNYLGPQSSILLFGILGFSYYTPDICEKLTYKGYIGL